MANKEESGQIITQRLGTSGFDTFSDGDGDTNSHRNGTTVTGGDTSDSETEEFSQSTPTPPWKARTVTIEPVLILYIFAGGIAWPAVKALFYKKVCLSHFNQTVCDHLHANSNHVAENVVQTETSHWFLWENYVFEIPAIIMSFIYGNISDRFSRRLAILMPVLGQVVTLGIMGLNAIYMDWNPGWILVGNAISGLTGGWITLFLAAFSYLATVTSEKERTKRVLVCEAMSGLSWVIPMLISGLILDNTSFTFVFSLSTGIFILTCIYIYTYMKEPPRKDTPKGEKARVGWFILKRLAYLYIDAIKTVFRKREKNARARLLAIITIVYSSMLSMYAYSSVGYLFVKRQPLSWSQTLYGYYLSFAHLLPALCLLVVITPVKERFKLEDTTLMMVGTVVGPLSELWLAFSTHTWMVFMVPIIGMFRSAGTVARASLSKLVEPGELGKMYAFLGAVQSVSSMTGHTIYNILYPATLDFWPGLSFCLGASTVIIPVSLIVWLIRDNKKERSGLHKEFSMNAHSEDHKHLLVSSDDDEVSYLDHQTPPTGSYFSNEVLLDPRGEAGLSFHTAI